MTFGDIKTEVGTWVIDLPTSVTLLIPNLVNRAIKKLQVKHNFKIMEAQTTLTTTVSTRLLGSVPALWKEPRGVPYYVEDLGDIREMKYAPSVGDALAGYGDDPDLDFGSPRLLTEDATLNQFNVYPYPDGISDYSDGEYRVVIPYWTYFAPLTDDAQTNWFTANAEDYIIYQTVAMAFYANEDEGRAQIWDGRANLEYKDVLLADKMRRLGEVQSLVPHLGARMPHTQE